MSNMYLIFAVSFLGFIVQVFLTFCCVVLLFLPLSLIGRLSDLILVFPGSSDSMLRLDELKCGRMKLFETMRRSGCIDLRQRSKARNCYVVNKYKTKQRNK